MTRRRAVETKSTMADDYEERHSIDGQMPDLIVDTPAIGRTLLHHAEGASCGYVARMDSNNEVAITIAKVGAYQEYKAMGLINLMTPEEARMMANGLNQMADHAEAAKKKRKMQ